MSTVRVSGRRNPQVSIGPLEAAIAVKQVEPKAVNAWQEGRLEFAREPLSMVIDTINRYSHREVVIADESVDELRFTGTVSREHIDEWLFALSEISPVDVRRLGNETVLISRRASQPAARSSPSFLSSQGD